MARKEITLDVAAFLDSPRARRLAAGTRPQEDRDLRRIAEALVTASYHELGKPPEQLDGQDVRELLTDALPGRLRPRDPALDRALDVVGAYFEHLEETRVVAQVFEIRHALAECGDAFVEAVRSGRAEPRGPGPQAPVVHRASKLGRNDPCFCGSGRKFKKCHGRSDA